VCRDGWVFAHGVEEGALFGGERACRAAGFRRDARPCEGELGAEFADEFFYAGDRFCCSFCNEVVCSARASGEDGTGYGEDFAVLFKGAAGGDERTSFDVGLNDKGAAGDAGDDAVPFGGIFAGVSSEPIHSSEISAPFSMMRGQSFPCGSV